MTAADPHSRLECTDADGQLVYAMDAANVTACLEPALEVVRQCGEPDFTVHISVPFNSDGVPLNNCTVSNRDSDCDGLFLPDALFQGASLPVNCSGEGARNDVSVSCEVLGQWLPGGLPMTVTAVDRDACP